MSASVTPERRLQNQRASHLSWANTPDWSARTANGRRAFDQKFLDEAGGDPQRAESLRKAFYAEMTLKSIASRRRKSRIAELQRLLNEEAELDDGGDDAA
jgi:hypothetical protein